MIPRDCGSSCRTRKPFLACRLLVSTGLNPKENTWQVTILTTDPFDIAAVLARFKPEGAEKFVLRPYTPVSDERKYIYYTITGLKRRLLIICL